MAPEIVLLHLRRQEPGQFCETRQIIKQRLQPFGKPPSIWAALLRLLWPLKGELALLVLIASAAVVPLLMIAGCTSQFIDAFLQQQRLSSPRRQGVTWAAVTSSASATCRRTRRCSTTTSWRMGGST